MNTPRFSVVIPTMRRARVLPSSLRSALAQTHESMEIVVSNNGDDADTRAVVEAMNDSRVRLIATPRCLLMPESWNFAVQQARGEFVVLLCDDDALHPRALEWAESILMRTGAEVVAWRACSYHTPDWGARSERGRLSFGPPYSDQVFEIDQEALLDAIYDMRVTLTDLVPKMLNCCVALPLLRRMADADVVPFHPSCPDYSALLVLTSYAGNMVMIDAPLLVAGATPESIGVSATQRGDVAEQYVRELQRDVRDLIVPDVVGPTITWIAQTFMQTAHRVPALHGREVNVVHLHGLARLELEELRGRGLDVGDWQAAFDEALRGPLAASADEIMAFAEQKRMIETESYLRFPGTSGPVSGHGAFQMSDRQVGGLEISEVAGCLDSWIGQRRQRLENLWNQLLSRAGRRTVVLFGMGQNGRALLRLLSGQTRFSEGRLAIWDDAAECTAFGLGAVRRREDLDPRRHFVCITPNESGGIATRLRRSGFRDHVDLCALAASATGASEGLSMNVRT